MKTRCCLICGVTLTFENCYPKGKNGTTLLSYCKQCYKKLNAKRYQNSKYSVTTNVHGARRRISFNTKEEKSNFIIVRRIYSKIGSRVISHHTPTDTYPGEYVWNGEVLASCPECGNLIQYDINGDEICTTCKLIVNSAPATESRIVSDMPRGRCSFSGEEDSACVDTFYTKAYSRSLR